MQIVRYSEDFNNRWNDFNASSKNGTFLFHRHFIEYHKDRFEDHSLLVLEKKKIVALLPANEKDNLIFSHGGLTYGGLVIQQKMRLQKYLEIFEKVLEYLSEHGFSTLTYKPVPHIYHRSPSEEDLYALFRCNASLAYRNVSAAIDMRKPERINATQRNLLRRVNKDKYTIRQSNDIQRFMDLVELLVRDKYGAKPTHSTEELIYLHNSFPGKIKLFIVESEGTLVGGTIIFETPTVAHTQYIASTSEAREEGAMVYLFDHLINSMYTTKWYFDFGTSNENGGLVLNEGLQYNKESFGARSIVYEGYRIDL